MQDRSCVETITLKCDSRNPTDAEYDALASLSKQKAVELSKKYPQLYVIVSGCFGTAWIIAKKRINTYDVESAFGGFWRNGVFKPFSKAQKIKYQNAGLCN